VIFKKNGVSYDVNGSPLRNAADPAAHFKKEYNLRSLPEVKAYIDKNHHLPEIPFEVIKNGLNLGQMNKLLMQKS
jgi:hypothetical protein